MTSSSFEAVRRPWKEKNNVNVTRICEVGRAFGSQTGRKAVIVATPPNGQVFQSQETRVQRHLCAATAAWMTLFTGGKGAGLQQCNLALQLLSNGEKKRGGRKSRSLTVSLHRKYLVTNNHPEPEFTKYSLCPTVSWSIIVFKNKSRALETAHTRI